MIAWMSLRVLTLNVWALPVGLARHTRGRLEAIARSLPGLDADLVALQEVWTARARAKLAQAGERAGLAHSWHLARSFGGSGLMLLSRWPILRPRFTAFEARGWPERIWHADWYGGKGFVVADVETSEGRLAIIDTHLHAGYAEADEYAGLRIAQVTQLAETTRTLGRSWVALGDFNMAAGPDGHALVTELLGARDAAALTGVPEPTVLSDSPYRPPGSPDGRLDLILLGPGVAVDACRRVLEGPLRIDGEPAAHSDHAGVLADVRVETEAPAPGPPAASAVGHARQLLDRGEALAHRRRRHARAGAAAALVGAAAGLAVQRRLTRRRALGVLLMGGTTLASIAAGASGWLAEDAIPDELDALAEARERLMRMLPGDAPASVRQP